MKRILWLAGLIVLGANAATAQTNTAPVRVGIYDSRVIAYAYFWSGPYQSDLKKQIAAAQAVQKSGDAARSKELDAAMREKQAESHRQVFSVAPVTNALATIQKRIPEIEKQAGVVALASKWDDAALKKYPGAETVDVTSLLVQEFIVPTEKQAKTIESFKNSKLIPLEECNELIRKGKL